MNDFERLTTLAKHRKQNFGRSVTTEIYRPGKDILAVSKMHDDYHDIHIIILVDGEKFTIKDIAARMERIPYPVCELSNNGVKRLIGLNIFKRGILKDVKEKYPRAEGCTHIFEMLESSFRALFGAISSFIGEQIIGDVHLELEESRQVGIANPTLRNTCMAFSEKDEKPELLELTIKKINFKQ